MMYSDYILKQIFNIQSKGKDNIQKYVVFFHSYESNMQHFVSRAVQTSAVQAVPAHTTMPLPAQLLFLARCYFSLPALKSCIISSVRLLPPRLSAGISPRSTHTASESSFVSTVISSDPSRSQKNPMSTLFENDHG